MRRAAHQLLNKEASRAHIPIQQAEATMMLCNILEDPQVSVDVYRAVLIVTYTDDILTRTFTLTFADTQPQ